MYVLNEEITYSLRFKCNNFVKKKHFKHVKVIF